MQPQTQPRKPRNSSKVNLAISATFHVVLVLALFYLAAREGFLGKQLQKISVEMVKEKQPEKPKEPEKPNISARTGSSSSLSLRTSARSREYSSTSFE